MEKLTAQTTFDWYIKQLQERKIRFEIDSTAKLIRIFADDGTHLVSKPFSALEDE